MRIFHRLAKAAGKGELLFRGERLSAKEDHEVIEERLANVRDDLVVQRSRDVHAVDFGTQRAGDRSHRDMTMITLRSRIHPSGSFFLEPRSSRAKRLSCDAMNA
ncbi:hypothetical protein D3C83_31700 [compost metagenome]